MEVNQAEVFDEILINDINFISPKEVTEKQEQFKSYKNIRNNSPNEIKVKKKDTSNSESSSQQYSSTKNISDSNSSNQINSDNNKPSQTLNQISNIKTFQSDNTKDKKIKNR